MHRFQFSSSAFSSARTLAATLAVVIATGVVADTTPVGTTFTYQGRLTQQGEPVSDPVTFRFRMFAQEAGGSHLCELVAPGFVIGDDGRFTIDLDFGVDMFNGEPRWLEVQVGTTTLSPRQPIMAAPYAMVATTAANVPTKAVVGSYMGITGVGTLDSLSVAGHVGIGTSTPQTALHVRGEQATLRLEDNDSPSSYSEILDAQPTQLRINKVNGSGDVLLDLNPKPSIDTDTALVRFFRETNTSGVKGLRLFRGNNTAQLSAIIGVDGGDSWFQAHGGNLGIGATDPQANLEVRSSTFPSLRIAKIHGGGFAVAAPAVLELQSSFPGTEGPYGSMRFLDGDAVTRASIDYGPAPGAFTPASMRFDTDSVTRMAITGAGNVGIGTKQPTTKLHVDGGSDSSPGGGGFLVLGTVAGANVSFDNNEIMSRNNGAAATLHLNADGGFVQVGQNSGGTGRLVTPILQITGGSDLSERFDIATVDNLQPQPGMVVCIDPANPGSLLPSTRAYDRTVAGIISGANGVNTGMIMGQKGSKADGEYAVALTGRVYVMADATSGAIVPGDLLTTSDVPGHAMKAIDRDRRDGAIIGKAMTPLAADTRGLVLVLVNLH